MYEYIPKIEHNSKNRSTRTLFIHFIVAKKTEKFLKNSIVIDLFAIL